jgi:hypothetical protein
MVVSFIFRELRKRNGFNLEIAICDLLAVHHDCNLSFFRFIFAKYFDEMFRWHGIYLPTFSSDYLSEKENVAQTARARPIRKRESTVGLCVCMFWASEGIAHHNELIRIVLIVIAVLLVIITPTLLVRGVRNRRWSTMQARNTFRGHDKAGCLAEYMRFLL